MKMPCFIFVFLLLASSVSPCTCEIDPPNKAIEALVSEELAQADAVFQGTVTSIEKFPLEVMPKTLPGKRFDQYRVTFKVRKSWKSVKQNVFILWTGLGHGDCGFDFRIGESYLVYEFQVEGTYAQANICTRTQSSKEAVADEKVLGHPIWVDAFRKKRQ